MHSFSSAHLKIQHRQSRPRQRNYVVPVRISLLFVATAHALVVAPTTDGRISVYHHFNQVSNQNGTSAFAGIELLEYSCDNSLDTGNFKNDPVTFHVNKWTGTGQITVAGKTFPIHSQPDDANAPICHRSWAAEQTTIECQVLMPPAWYHTVNPISEPKDDACFGSVGIHLPYERQEFVEPEPVVNSSTESSALDARQYCFNEFTSIPDHNVACTQNWWGHHQTTATIHCGKYICTATNAISRAITVGATFGGTLYKVVTITGAVQYAKITMEEYSCEAQPGESVCVYFNTQYKECVFENVEKTFCNSKYSSEKVVGTPVKVWYPMSPVDTHSTYSCSNICSGKDTHYIDNKFVA